MGEIITLVNPSTGVRLQFTGRHLRNGRATDSDIRRGRARFRGDKVYLDLPAGVQVQYDKGVLQLDTDYEARVRHEEASTLDQIPMPAGNSSHESWISYAVSQGMERDEAVRLTRNQIKARFTEVPFDPDAPPDLEMLDKDE
jgi:hypothetical protein